MERMRPIPENVRQFQPLLILHRVIFALAWKPYWIGLLFTHENGVFGAISVTERSYAARISKVESHISCVFTLQRIDFAPARKPYRRRLLLTNKIGDFSAIFVTERSYAARITKVESYISDMFSHYTGQVLRRHGNHTGYGFCSQIKTMISARSL